jgi:hypothetical protein
MQAHNQPKSTTKREQPVGARHDLPLQTMFFILIVLLIAFALRIHNLDGESIWHDEGWSIRAMRGPFTTPDDNTPFLYYFTGHVLWKAGAGDSALAFRYVSVLIGLVTVALAMRIGRRWYGTGAGLAGGLLVGVSPLLWQYSQEVRAYVAVPLIALALLAGAEAVLRRQRGEIVPRRVWAFVFALELAGLYTHNLSVPLIVWLNAALGIAWLWRRDWAHMLTWAGLQIALTLSYIPWILTQSPSGTPLNTPPDPSLTLVRDIWASYFLPVLVQLRDAQTGVRTGSDILTPLALFGCVGVGIATISSVIAYKTNKTSFVGARHDLPYKPQLGRRGGSMYLYLLISHAILVPVFSTALMLAAHIDFHPRYYIAAVPGTLLLLVGSAMSHRYPTKRIEVATITLVLFPALLFSALSIHQINTTRAYQHDDFAGLAAYYATLPEDTVILIPFDVERALQDYYLDEFNIQAKIINIPLYADEETALATINEVIGEGTRQVEFLTWFQLPADVRGMYPCLLTALSDEVGETRTFYGLMTKPYTLHPGGEFTSINAAPSYHEIALVDAAYLASRRGICLRTSWQPQGHLNENISVAATVLNPINQEIARADTEITRTDNAGTAHWDSGETGQTYHLLRLPPGAPLMTYALTLNVYSPSSPSGFDVLDATGNPAGKLIHLDDAVTAQGQPAAFTETAVLDDNVGDSGSIETGKPLDITLALTAPDAVMVSLALADWTVEQSATSNSDGLLSWHHFIIPPGNSGEAILSVNGLELARYTVIDLPRIFDIPDFDTEIDVDFPGVGRLVGITLANTTVSPDNPPLVTLVWQAALPQNAEIAYTIFVQLLDEEGRLLAQSDSQPANGTRPTTGWASGEFIVDPHTLHFNITGYEGTAVLIAGFYDANDRFRRVLTADGFDQVGLNVPVRVVTENP